MELKDKLVLEWTTHESKDYDNRVVRTTEPNAAAQWVDRRWEAGYQSTWLTEAGMINGTVGNRSFSGNLPTWFKREVMRLAAGVYARSSVTDLINTHYPEVCAHISAHGGDMVAYTPSTEAGNVDKQLATPIGRLLRKTFVLCTDKWVADQTAEHVGEVSATYSIATTPAEIARVYTEMAGDSGCMRYDKSHWGHDVHPSAAYAGPNLGVAFIEINDVIKSRSVVYINGDDKRYVRNYGPPLLEKILKRNGFKCKSLLGAKLARIPKEGEDNAFIVPYLDGPNGAQSDGDSFVVDDGDHLVVVNMSTQRSLGSTYVQQAKNHSTAMVTLQMTPQMKWVSDFSGITYNKLSDGQPKTYIGVRGELCQIAVSELDSKYPSGYWDVITLVKGVQAVTTVSNSERTFYHHGKWLDTDANRAACGHKKVTSVWDKMPIGSWLTHIMTVADENFQSIEVTYGTDCAHVMSEAGLHYSMPIGAQKLLPKRDYVRCGRVDEQEVFCHKNAPKLRRSVGGSWFIEGYHDGYVQCEVSQKWHAKKQTHNVNAWGRSFIVARDITATPAVLLDVHNHVADWRVLRADPGTTNIDSLRALLRGVSATAGSLVYHQVGRRTPLVQEGRVTSHYGRTRTYEVLRSDVQACLALDGPADHFALEVRDLLDIVGEHYLPLKATLEALVNRLELELAGQQTLEEIV